MTNETIQALTAGTPPLPAGTLFETEIPIGGGAYSTRSFTYSQIVPATKLEQLSLDWDSNTPVVAGTSYALLASQWSSATITSCSCVCAGGTFAAAIQISGSSVTGLSAVTVTSTPATTTATGGNTLATGGSVSVVISGVTGTPTTAIIQINLSTSVN